MSCDSKGYMLRRSWLFALIAVLTLVVITIIAGLGYTAAEYTGDVRGTQSLAAWGVSLSAYSCERFVLSVSIVLLIAILATPKRVYRHLEPYFLWWVLSESVLIGCVYYLGYDLFDARHGAALRTSLSGNGWDDWMFCQGTRASMAIYGPVANLVSRGTGLASALAYSGLCGLVLMVVLRVVTGLVKSLIIRRTGPSLDVI